MRRTDRTLFLFLSGMMIVGCHRTTTPAANAAPAAATGIVTGGGGDRCPEARLIAAPATINGDLTTRHDDSNARIEATGYSWAGRDDFFAMDLQAGQTLTFMLDEHGSFDGGIYVFRDCANIPGTVVNALDTSATRPFVFTAPAAGRYLVAVDAWITNTGGPYTLTVTPGGTPAQ